MVSARYIAAQALDLGPMPAGSVRRVRVHLPASEEWPATVRGVGSMIDCPTCGVRLRARTHAEVRKALRFHRLEAHG